VQFIQAKNYTPAAPGRQIDLVVIHTMEAKGKPGTALAVARWFAGVLAPEASAHYCVDDQTVIGCVHEGDVAWAAALANKNGVHIEHAGFTARSQSDWADASSQAMLARSAILCAEICWRHSIPIKKLGSAELVQKERGICGHSDVTQAFGKSTHTDPGGSFPWEQYLALVRAEMADLDEPDLVTDVDVRLNL
jgi:N-acetyl-anhydromuramyl-L-alanine amidase AmpD